MRPRWRRRDVVVAMGGGSDVAIETAHVSMRHSLMGRGGCWPRATLRNMKQNLLGAFICQTALVSGTPVFPGRLPVPC